MERVSTITHPSGKSLHFCERLTNFVMNRPKEHPFIIGHWFQSLEDNDLVRIQKLAHAVLEDRQGEFEDFEVDDVVGLVTIAASVETDDRMSFGPDDLHDLVGALLMASGVSYMSRLGWLKTFTPLSILPSASVELEITNSGLAAAQRTDDPLMTAIFSMASTRH
jgi:hypothetical protein